LRFRLRGEQNGCKLALLGLERGPIRVRRADFLLRVDAAVRSHIWLLISGISPNVWAFRLDRNSMMVGRNAACEIRILDDSVSRYHARIERLNGEWHIIDHGSTNGTYLNGKPVKQAEFHVGDTLRIGLTKLIVAKGSEKSPDVEFAIEGVTPPISSLRESSIRPSDTTELTEKQLRVLQLLRDGLSQKQIAAALGVCESTVHTHIKHIYAAFGAHSHPHLMAILDGSDGPQ
jgi:DNA-binding CsgD family transcriptional regulator